ncbi:MAG: trypsin-like peptidase domain-containing protein [Planctomycetes bacterium]|nr:trypsin-like peptidase domain-containing protein [Planctomycetota bacterium]
MKTHGRRKLVWAAAAAILASSAFGTRATGQEVPRRPASVSDLFEKVRPAVVGIDAYQTVPKGLWVNTRDFINPFPLRSFIGDTLCFLFYIPRAILYPFSSHRTGSGFIIDKKGYVLTSYHIVDQYNVFAVRLFDGSSHSAELVGSDPLGDIALLKIDISELKEAVYPLPMGDSDKVKPGDWVMVMGNPLGLDYTVTTGIISGVGRRIGATALDDLIQVDAALDAGNSGGPILNADGQVIGIAAAQIFLAQNKGFAVPINMASSVLDDLKADGYPRRGRIGVVVEDPTILAASVRGLPKPVGALIVSVEHNSPAHQAGLRPTDLVLEYDGKKVANSLDLVRLVRRTKPGDEATVKVLSVKKWTLTKHPPPAELHVFTVRPVMIKRGFRVF